MRLVRAKKELSKLKAEEEARRIAEAARLAEVARLEALRVAKEEAERLAAQKAEEARLAAIEAARVAEERRAASTEVQRAARGVLARHERERRRLRRVAAAVAIQCAARRLSAKRERWRRQRGVNEIKATLLIQRVARGRFERKKWRALYKATLAFQASSKALLMRQRFLSVLSLRRASPRISPHLPHSVTFAGLLSPLGAGAFAAPRVRQVSAALRARRALRSRQTPRRGLGGQGTPSARAHLQRAHPLPRAGIRRRGVLRRLSLLFLSPSAEIIPIPLLIHSDPS